MELDALDTPSLVLDLDVLERNAARMRERADAHGVRLRPHLKTLKSADACRVLTQGSFGGITVSTLREAAYFVEHGVHDITYAVCITPSKVGRARALSAGGARLSVITDSLDVARALAEDGDDAPLHVLIEVDSGEHRTGMAPDDAALPELAAVLDAAPGLALDGVLTHAGHSYQARSVAEVVRIAEEERAAAVHAAERLREAGFACPVVSVGSTPTVTHAAHFEGVTEVRPGVYAAGDLFQAAISSCTEEDIAVSVLASVIGHDRQRNRLMLDAGGLALSKDRSTAATRADAGYGRVVGIAGEDLGPLQVVDVHQEHGEVRAADDRPLPFDALPVGARVRVLPNHACMTCAAHDRYHVVRGTSPEVVATWPRANGW